MGQPARSGEVGHIPQDKHVKHIEIDTQIETVRCNQTVEIIM